MDEPTPTRTWRNVVQTAAFQGLSAAVVAVGCYSTVRLLPFLRETYWAPIAAVVVLYPTREATKKAAFDRFAGTVIGSLVGWGSATWWNQNVLLYGLAVLLAVGLCHLLRLEAASRLCAVAVTVITIIPRDEPAHLVALFRFIEVSYGVGWALAYTVLTDEVRRRWQARLGAQRSP
jgi:uncharacterized membrane protein YgaE (UPF0421/DUF939 family)